MSTAAATLAIPSYWRFWWPLALVGLAMPLGQVVITGGLARLPDGVTEVATIAYAQGLFHLAQAAMAFVPQATTVMARSDSDYRRCRRLVVALAVALMVPMVLLGGPLRGVLALLYGIEGPVLAAAADYIRWLSPLLLVHAVVGFHVGLLVRHQRTGWVSTATLVNLLAVGSMVSLASFFAWSPLIMVVGSLAVGNGAQAALLVWAWRRTPRDLTHGDEPPKSFRILGGFFWPLAITSLMFAASRPVIYAVVGYTEHAVLTVAVLRVAFDLGLLAQVPVNQFRHLLVTFVARDPQGVARFMRQATTLIAVLALLVIASPISQWLLAEVLGIDPALVPAVRSTWLILVLVPVTVAWRNWHHGLAMVRQRTRAMAGAAVLRVVGTGGLCFALLPFGLLNHHAGACALVLGFMVEALMVRQWGRRHAHRPLSADG